MNHLFVLGASDPEMAAIENLIRDCGQVSIRAVRDGQRVHPGNAYRYSVSREQLSEAGFTETMAAGATLVFVECGADPLPPNSIRVDHHHPGDPGYGKLPENFLSASSIGQILILLGFHCSLVDGQRQWGCVADSAADKVAEMMAFNWSRTPGFLINAVLVAAADHCLAAAYRGECPGVEPQALRAWRIKSRAEFQGRNELEILCDVERAESALKSAPRIEIAGVQIADLRGPVIPELPEAATYLGIPYLASIAERDGRPKVVISAPEPALCAFMNFWASAQGLTGIYGDPVRGFAGAYA